MDMCRQLWDEARHAMMGEIYFESLGINWREMVALNPGFSIVNNMKLSTDEAHAWLYLIEQGLMSRVTGKRYELEISQQAQHPLAALFQDFDWADEVLHVHFGRRWLVAPSGLKRAEYEERWVGLSERAEEMINDLPGPEKQASWWPEFVRHALGKESSFDT
jgi:hypothetical protein